MVTIASLWLPILLSAVAVWIVSAIVWMALPYHKSDFKGIADEEAARDVLRSLTPGQYSIPFFADRADMGTEVGKVKYAEGPVAIVTALPRGMPKMGRSLGQWFVMNLLVGILVAYVASRSLPAGADYMAVFRLTAILAWMAYGVGLIQKSIWFGVPWSNTAKQLFDSLLYGLVTAGFFGWLWPGGAA